MAACAERRSRLVGHILSPCVQVPLPLDTAEVPARLSGEQVVKVFTENVVGVRTFLFRQKRGVYVLKFISAAYRDGLQAFTGTKLNNHLVWLMRTIVHYGHEGGPFASRHLTEVAEAFMDCQAVQARAIERVGLQILGVETDFAGLMTRLVGEYKTITVKMLAAERLANGLATDYDANPTHYVNRLTADIGEKIGLNADDVRRAKLDEHARSRFRRLQADEAETAAARCRELFDLEAFLGAFVAEVLSFRAESPPTSFPRLFLDWASANLAQKHVVLDEATCMKVQIDAAFALCVVETVYFGRPAATKEESFRGVPVLSLFTRPHVESQDPSLVGEPARGLPLLTFEEAKPLRLSGRGPSARLKCDGEDYTTSFIRQIFGRLCPRRGGPSASTAFKRTFATGAGNQSTRRDVRLKVVSRLFSPKDSISYGCTV